MVVAQQSAPFELSLGSRCAPHLLMSSLWSQGGAARAACPRCPPDCAQGPGRTGTACGSHLRDGRSAVLCVVFSEALPSWNWGGHESSDIKDLMKPVSLHLMATLRHR